MHTSSGRKDQILLHASILVLCMVPVILSFFMQTDGYKTEFRFQPFSAGIGIPCLFKALTGYRCPACGMTRSFVYMSGLHIPDALKMNTAGALLYFYCLLQLPYRLLLLAKPGFRLCRVLSLSGAVLLGAGGISALTGFILQFI